MRLAIVTEDLTQYGGAERVLEVLHETFPDAPVYTSLYDPTALPPPLRHWDIRTSFLQRLPLSRRYHRALLLLYPLAYESFDLSGFDVVLSISSRFAHGVITPPATVHVDYCLSPMRFAWNYREYVAGESIRPWFRAVLPAAMHYLRLWDVAASQRVDRFIGISSAVQARIKKYYRRDSDLVFPPVETEQIPLGGGRGENFLVVSRLIPYKRVDLAVAACSQLRLPLTVIGAGRHSDELASGAGPTVKFLGHVSDAARTEALGDCKAFIFPGEEDFGIAPVEAMAAGRPVVAYAGGGALDTVIESQTGQLFSPQTVEALADKLGRFDAADFDPAVIRRHALRFSRGAFQEQMEAQVNSAEPQVPIS
ncbi:MAG: glycosyltransferase family 4 protein [Chloroflexi bacterium]|nr:glycosyltransferase family 4 protein [Chloroflexota bacterium]